MFIKAETNNKKGKRYNNDMMKSKTARVTYIKGGGKEAGRQGNQRLGVDDKIPLSGQCHHYGMNERAKKCTSHVRGVE